MIANKSVAARVVKGMHSTGCFYIPGDNAFKEGTSLTEKMGMSASLAYAAL